MSNTRMPVLFVGHGSPMNAIEDNEWSRAFRGLAAHFTGPRSIGAGELPRSIGAGELPRSIGAGELPRLPKPRAIVSVSAHWYVEGSFTTANERPETIHDFGGFPRELYEIVYPAAGDPALADRVVRLLGDRASLRTDWGLDHGTWSVLMHVFPQADVPVIQLSIDHRLPPAEHLAFGRALAPLRDEGVLVLGSGNITHNLRHAFQSMHRGERLTPDWAERFDRGVSEALLQHDGEYLARAVESEDGRMAHPSLDHYLPLLYAAGAAGGSGAVSFPIEGFDLSSLSMRSVLFE